MWDSKSCPITSIIRHHQYSIGEVKSKKKKKSKTLKSLLFFIGHNLVIFGQFAAFSICFHSTSKTMHSIEFSAFHWKKISTVFSTNMNNNNFVFLYFRFCSIKLFWVTNFDFQMNKIKKLFSCFHEIVCNKTALSNFSLLFLFKEIKLDETWYFSLSHYSIDSTRTHKNY